ncbi:MAG: DUF2148 domain-containing protein [Clostridiales Family XIII bacterium]|jgi:uncharacterized ferredoxin-like protein|nr:DUF2148 domain-containing protein [Clostridiales Family XIII bacterium]
MKITAKEAERSAIYRVAEGMLAAARTAPKGKGIDNLETLILDGDDKDALAAEMRKIHEEVEGYGPFGRDAGNLDDAELIVLIAVKNKPGGLKHCAYCGFSNCAEMAQAGANCAFNITDLGIAVGSAAAVAMDGRIDNRVLYSAGKAAVRMGLFSESVRVAYGIPLSVTSKSIFFDRYDPVAGRK